MERQPCVYMLASKRNGTLYTGVTSNLLKRVWEHKNNLIESFTSKYGVHTLVWYELHGTMESAIQREKTTKNWKRVWKLKVIEKMNSNWHDLYSDLL
jgi:putative endonuclease